MAIKVQGTTVIDDTRNLTNINTIQGLTYPSSDGTEGQVLATDGAGNVNFVELDSGGPSQTASIAISLLL
jgi:hypothetical protein